ncbi:hypothetical protein FIU87_03810 [Bacillus sp. THAF10]|uniref:hypothetical protein n=1 Tax=Bacillus sp. THAF10 TaxID=2587848 RepID=UPI0012683C33|nr:hypothetical protein [Bacillus sp. THAF10]QFT87770.1 hypothetical protein FIU87_03810 [Bacillus sp. THAF10]
MRKKEKKWRLFYKIIMIVIYAVILPLSALLFFIGEGGIPWGIIVAAIALPFMRDNHIKKIRQG